MAFAGVLLLALPPGKAWLASKKDFLLKKEEEKEVKKDN